MNNVRTNYNDARPMVMHIDLNSCFATIEQQSRPRLRGRPVGIVNRISKNACVITASYEAKARGVKVGMRAAEARRLAPGIVLVESDPAKYRYVYRQLMRIMGDYSPHFTMKSIDEGVIDFKVTTSDIQTRSLEDIGREIKLRLRTEVGCAMRCNVGIGTNRFLAKTAAGLHKPDGLDVITADNLRQIYASMQLTDITGIAGRNQKRLNAVGIFTPLEFLDAPEQVLHEVVFKSICGSQWYERLRGWEVDDVEYDLKSVGRQYVLESSSLTRKEITQRLHHLSESVGAKLRSQSKCARGVEVHARTYEHERWHKKILLPLPFFSDSAIWAVAAKAFIEAPPRHIREIGITCYHLEDGIDGQLSIFGDGIARQTQITGAIDDINKRYGERTIHSADTLGTGVYVRQKIPFGSTRYL